MGIEKMMQGGVGRSGLLPDASPKSAIAAVEASVGPSTAQAL